MPVTIGPAALITRAGLPTATEFGGIGRDTTEPAPIVEPAPTSDMTTAAAPIQQSAPILTEVNTPSWLPVIRPFSRRACWWLPLTIWTPEAICVRAPISVLPIMQ